MTEAKQAVVPEEKLESIIRDFEEAFTKRDVEKMMTFFTEDTRALLMIRGMCDLE